MSAAGIERVTKAIEKKVVRQLGKERIDFVKTVFAVGPKTLETYISNEIIHNIREKAKKEDIEPQFDKKQIERSSSIIAKTLNTYIQKEFEKRKGTVRGSNIIVERDTTVPVEPGATAWSVRNLTGKARVRKDNTSVFNFLNSRRSDYSGWIFSEKKKLNEFGI